MTALATGTGSWVIQLSMWGSFLYQGTQAEAEARRAHKARWEQEIAHLRPATPEEIVADRPLSRCWNHPLFLEVYPKRRRFQCECGACPPEVITTALAIQQPWAWLIVNGHKDVENREWITHRRGRFLIHASKKVDTWSIPWIRERFPSIDLPESYEVGGIVGEARLVDCVTESTSKWFRGVYGFVLSDAKPLPFRPVRGVLGFFEVPRAA
jgi:hypothetical protein